MSIVDVAWTGARFIAFGSDTVDGGSVLLDSSDGLRWHRQATDLANVEPTQLAVGPRGIVAIGERFEGTAGTATWVSEEGLTWASQEEALVDFDHNKGTWVLVGNVVAMDDGWLAVGTEIPLCMTDCPNAPTNRQTIWTSGDGLEWTRLVDQPSALSGDGMWRVVRGGPGYVGVGWAGLAHDEDERISGNAAVWTSKDGLVWSRVKDAAAFHPPPGSDPTYYTSMSDVSAAGGQVMATGSIGNDVGERTALAWWSRDGTDWSVVADQRPAGAGFDIIVSIPGGFVAIGTPGRRGCPGSSVWSSPDGTLYDLLTTGDEGAWSCPATGPTQSDFTMHAAAASPNLLVLVGEGAQDDDLDIWVRALQ